MVPENFREDESTRQTRYFNYIRTEAYITNTWVTIDQKTDITEICQIDIVSLLGLVTIRET
jgi:hypothetical protein